MEMLAALAWIGVAMGIAALLLGALTVGEHLLLYRRYRGEMRRRLGRW